MAQSSETVEQLASAVRRFARDELISVGFDRTRIHLAPHGVALREAVEGVVRLIICVFSDGTVFLDDLERVAVLIEKEVARETALVHAHRLAPEVVVPGHDANE